MKAWYSLRCFVVCCILLLIASCEAMAGLEEALFKLAQRCRESKSDAVLVTRNGRVLFEYRSDLYWEPIDTMAITKSIVALAVGIMIDEGKLKSIDEPVCNFYPEWRQGYKQYVTIRHLLTHTSGLQCEDNTDQIYCSQDIIQFALCAELTNIPGTHYFYNNKALNLISGITKIATGLSLSEYLTVKLFTPMGIDNVSWLSDPAGNDYAMAHLIITAPDLAKIGEMLENGGCYNGCRLISKKWIDQMLCPATCLDPFSGLLWWIDYHNVQCYWDDPLLKTYECNGINCDLIRRLRCLCGRVVNCDGRTTTPRGCNFFGDEMINILGGKLPAECFTQQVVSKQLPLARWCIGGIRSFSARGYLGQQLIIFPGRKVVAVRLVRYRGRGENEIDPFHDFGALVDDLSYRAGF